MCKLRNVSLGEVVVGKDRTNDHKLKDIKLVVDELKRCLKTESNLNENIQKIKESYNETIEHLEGNLTSVSIDLELTKLDRSEAITQLNDQKQVLKKQLEACHEERQYGSFKVTSELPSSSRFKVLLNGITCLALVFSISAVAYF